MDHSVWVALFPNKEAAEYLASFGSESPDDIHLTLAFLGVYPLDLLKECIDAAVLRTMLPPTKGYISGFGSFIEPNVQFALADVPGLIEFRQNLIKFLPTVDRTYDYIPHITVNTMGESAYAMSQLYWLKRRPITFGGVTLVHGNSRTLIPWGGLK